MGKTLAMVFGWGFLIIGILGFISNPLVGANGLFATDTVHNLVHLISGAIFLWVAYGAPSKTGAVLKIFGVVYLLVALLGFFTVMSGGQLLGLMLTNSADHYLHLVLGIVFLLAGLKASKGEAPAAQPMM